MKMRNNIKALLFAAVAVAFAPGCNDINDDYDDLVPEEYDKILSFKNAGNVDVEMSVAERAHVYTMNVLKGGIHIDRAVDALFEVETQEYVDVEYNERQGFNYKVLSADMYRVTDYRLRIPAGRSGLGAQVTFDAPRIYAEMMKDENKGKEFVLPVRLTALADSVNSSSDEIIMHCSVKPAVVSFINERQSVTLPANEEQASFTIDVQKSGEIDVNVGFEILSQEYVDENYGNPEGIDYRVVPSDCVTIEPKGTIGAKDEFYSHACLIDMDKFNAISEQYPAAVWVVPVKLVSHDGYLGVNREVSLITLGYHEYEKSPLNTKESWQIAYGTIAMPFGKFEFMYDGSDDGEGWMGYINDGFPNSQNLGNPYVVIDLGAASLISKVEVQLGVTGGGFWDTMPVAVDFYVTGTSALNPELSSTDRGLLNATGNYGDQNHVNDAYIALHNRLREYDNTIEWVKLGSLTGIEPIPSATGRYSVTVPEIVLNNRIFSRYLKIVCHPAAYGTTPGDRTKIHEVYLEQVLKIDGKPID